MGTDRTAHRTARAPRLTPGQAVGQLGDRLLAAVATGDTPAVSDALDDMATVCEIARKFALTGRAEQAAALIGGIGDLFVDLAALVDSATVPAIVIGARL